MRQEFNEVVDQVAAGDIKNYFASNAPAPDGFLGPRRREALNGLVAAVADECNQSSRHLWVTVVHVATGVNTVGQIRDSQYQDAVNALEQFRENFREQRRREDLRVRLKELSAGKKSAEELKRFCLAVLGDAHLYDMPSEKLREAVAHMERYQQQQRELLIEAKTAGQQAEPMLFGALLRQYPIHCFVIGAVGFLLGLMF